MGAGKWMVFMLVAGVGIGVGAANLANGGMRQWAERFGQHEADGGQTFVALSGAGDDSRMRVRMPHHEYNDEEGYPLEGNDGDFAYAPEPAFQQAPPGQVVILRAPGWGYDDGRSDADDGDYSEAAPRAYAEAAPRARVYVPGPQYAPSAPPRTASPAAPPQDAAAAAAERARAAAADVTAAEHGTI